MIRYLKHDQIDKQRWDEGIRRSFNRRIYAFSWYLDRVSPRWEAIVSEDYSQLFPLTGNRKWSFRYLRQPFFAQQLGIFAPHALSIRDTMIFFGTIPSSYRFAEIHLNSLNTPPDTGWNCTYRRNFELSLKPAYEDLFRNFSQNTKRNLKKAAQAGVTEGGPPAPEKIVTLFAENFGSQEGKLKKENYQTMSRLMQDIMDRGHGWPAGVYTSGDSLSACAFFAHDHDRIYFLFAASDRRARENGAMFLLVDRFIHRHAGQPLKLDFEGGNDPGTGRFYEGFGAMETMYPFISMNRLPFVINKGRNLLQKMGI